ncbi:hypothetical protein V8F20_000804 [Naviculisporaceae sp. PSN 640]
MVGDVGVVHISKGSRAPRFRGSGMMIGAFRREPLSAAFIMFSAGVESSLSLYHHSPLVCALVRNRDPFRSLFWYLAAAVRVQDLFLPFLALSLHEWWGAPSDRTQVGSSFVVCIKNPRIWLVETGRHDTVPQELTHCHPNFPALSTFTLTFALVTGSTPVNDNIDFHVPRQFPVLREGAAHPPLRSLHFPLPAKVRRHSKRQLTARATDFLYCLIRSQD